MDFVVKRINRIYQKIDPFSLRVRTIGIAALSAIGVGGIALRTTWQMQQILINSQDNIEQVADRLPSDVALYSEMLPIEIGLHRAIANLSNSKTIIWVKRPDVYLLFSNA